MQEGLIRVALEALEGSTGCDRNGIHPVLDLNEEIRKLILERESLAADLLEKRSSGPS